MTRHPLRSKQLATPTPMMQPKRIRRGDYARHVQDRRWITTEPRRPHAPDA